MTNKRMPRGAIPSPRQKLAAAKPYTIDETTPGDEEIQGPLKAKGGSGAKKSKSAPRGSGKKRRGV